MGYSKPGGGLQYEREASSGYEPCDASGDSASFPAKVPSFAGITVDGLTVTSDSSEVAATPTVPLSHPLRGQVPGAAGVFLRPGLVLPLYGTSAQVLP